MIHETKAAPRIREPIQQRSKETRARIIEAARDMFAEHGFDSVTTTMIAQKANISIGSVYAHFTDKIEIFHEILAHHSEAVYRYAEQQVMGLIETNGPPNEALDRLVPDLYRAHKLAGKLNYEMNRFVIMNEEAFRIRNRWEDKEDEIILRFLEHFRDWFVIDDPASAAVIIHRSFHEVFMYLFRNQGRVDEDRILAQLVRMLKRYIIEEIPGQEA